MATYTQWPDFFSFASQNQNQNMKKWTKKEIFFKIGHCLFSHIFFLLVLLIMLHILRTHFFFVMTRKNSFSITDPTFYFLSNSIRIDEKKISFEIHIIECVHTYDECSWQCVADCNWLCPLTFGVWFDFHFQSCCYANRFNPKSFFPIGKFHTE